MHCSISLLILFNFCLLIVFFLIWLLFLSFFFFFNDTATTEIYTLSLHDALPIWPHERRCASRFQQSRPRTGRACDDRTPDRKSTRLNSSHANISYAVFCLKKKKKKERL